MAEALRWLHGRGYTIHMITARPESVLGATRRWLRMHNVSDFVEEIHCVAGGPAKLPLAQELGCTIFVEDNYATAESVGMAGIRSYLLDAPYNRLPSLYSRRVQGWPELLQELDSLTPTARGGVEQDTLLRPVSVGLTKTRSGR
jgi:uncharacterized HAD superfamily protein